MANFVANWVGVDSSMAGQPLTSAYTVGSNPAYTNGIEPSSQFMQGSDPSLGVGQFVYAQMSNAAGCTLGNVVELTNTTYTSGVSVSLVLSCQQWAGTVNSGKTLAVALATLLQNQFGWFQVYGNALMTCSGTVVALDGAYWQAAGVVQSTAVASKQMLSTQCMVAPSASFGQGSAGVTPTLTAGQAIYFINNPVSQGKIT
jgi:hypothetical protein